MCSCFAPRALLSQDPTLHSSLSTRKAIQHLSSREFRLFPVPGVFDGSHRRYPLLENLAGAPLMPTAMVGTTRCGAWGRRCWAQKRVQGVTESTGSLAGIWMGKMAR